MPRQNNETDHDYKRRVIDIKSASFCGAKWYNATIWLGSGMTTSCHHPLPHHVTVDEVKANPKALHNTEQKKIERKYMQTGDRPKGCEYCWKIEDRSPNNISDRVYKTVIYSDKDLENAQNSSWYQDVNLQTLEISFNRTCQFACSYCNPAFSSTWANDIKRDGPYFDIHSDGRSHYSHDHLSSQLYKLDEFNPYVEAFFKWWESDLHKTLKELRITGGEPLMSDEIWHLMNWFKNNANTDMKFAINSNLGAKSEIIDKLIAATNHIPHFHLYTSNETYGHHAEYVRDGLVWEDWVSNVNSIMSRGRVEGLHMMCTVNALCLDSLDLFLDMILEWKAKWGKDFPTFTLNMMQFPYFQSAMVLPLHIRLGYRNNIQRWYDMHKDNPLLHQMEREHLIRLIDFLGSPEPADPEFLKMMQSDFKNFFTQYDRRRGKDFCDTFPFLASWYESISQYEP